MLIRQTVVFPICVLLFRVSFCSISDKSKHLGSRTPYRFIQNDNDAPIKYPGCNATRIWMFSRHGTRLPSEEEILLMKTTLYSLRDKIINQFNKGKGSLTADVISNFAAWETELDPMEEKTLAHEGQQEHMLLAERMQNRFPEIILKKYDNTSFEFRFTATERTQQSAKYFTLGLFDPKDAKNAWFPTAKTWDPVLRFYKVCKKYRKKVKNNETALREQTLYGGSKQMFAALKVMSDYLGFDDVLSLDEGMLIYQACGYETAWYKNKHSPWCDAFDTVVAEVLEYYDDLELYWIDGYGYEISYKPACVTIKDLFEHFSNKERPRASFLFSHSGAVLKIMAHLGLYKPQEPLTHLKKIEKRPWKASHIDSFATNLAFVLYQCQDEERVLTLHQERIIRLPPCKEDLCPMSVLTHAYHDSIHNCDFNKMCHNKKHK